MKLNYHFKKRVCELFGHKFQGVYDGQAEILDESTNFLYIFKVKRKMLDEMQGIADSVELTITS